MSLGDEWAETTPGSASKLNQVTVTYGTGAYLASLNKANHKLLVCTSTGSGFTLDHVYLCTADGLSTLDLSDVNEHVHDSTVSGGEFSEILRNNKDIIDTGFTLIAKPDKANWGEVTTGTASIANDATAADNAWAIKIDTGATISSVGSLHQPTGIQMDLGYASHFKSMQHFGTASSLAYRIGPGMDKLSSADSNIRKYGAEVCTSVNNNWFVRTANGTTSSASDSGTSAMNTSRQVTRLEHFPTTPKVDMYIDEGTAFTKTTHIPTDTGTNEPNPDSIMLVSLKNNTGSSRTVFLYGVRLVYKVVNVWNN